jgi:diguanylate cyclase (GGDEF)-like protein
VCPIDETADERETMLGFDIGSGPTDGLTPLEALLELTRSAAEDPLEEFLSTVTETVCRTAGFSTAVLNLYRPAWDDYEAAFIVGQQESIDALTGTTEPRSAFRRILAEGEQPLPGLFWLPEESGLVTGLENIYVPQLPRSSDPDAWRALDGLFVFLADSHGAPLGMLSLDEPVSGRRPTEDDLRLIRVICSHAEQALESAQRADVTADHQRILSLLLETSPRFSGCATATELFELAGSTVIPELGFERFAAYLATGADLSLCATRGWEDTAMLPATLSIREIDSLLAPSMEHAGCFLGSAAELFGDIRVPVGERSARNGRGATAWCDHCLVVPCRSGEELRGLIVIEDPIDRRLPSEGRRRAVRLLVDQVAAALLTVDHRSRLDHLASHDPLTGVRNRRGLDEVVAAHREVALLVCDLDRFKEINDRFGHDSGDRALASFGDLLRELARESDVPIRLGGEEFCVVLPNTDSAGAVQAAERLRLETSRRLKDCIPGGVTVSIGVAATARGVLDARALLAAADRGLYAAKAAGRNRSVLVSDDPAR